MNAPRDPGPHVQIEQFLRNFCEFILISWSVCLALSFTTIEKRLDAIEVGLAAFWGVHMLMLSVRFFHFDLQLINVEYRHLAKEKALASDRARMRAFQLDAAIAAMHCLVLYVISGFLLHPDRLAWLFAATATLMITDAAATIGVRLLVPSGRDRTLHLLRRWREECWERLGWRACARQTWRLLCGT